MIKTLEDTLKKAEFPEDIFGWDATRSEAVKQFKRYRSMVHEDKFEDDDMKAYVGELFKTLHDQWKIALERFTAGTYGDKAVVINSVKGDYVIKSKTASYTIEKSLDGANLCDVFKSTDGHVLKIARTHKDNDLLETEAKIYKAIEAESDNEYVSKLIGKYVETFKIKNASMEKVVVNVLEFEEKDITVQRLVELNGGKPFDPRHIIWIWKRILSAIGGIHKAGYVHGAIVPSNVMITPYNHGCRVIDFCYATKHNSCLVVVDSQYPDFYPPEIASAHHTNKVGYDFDIYMTGKLMIYLLGGDVALDTLPDYVPNRMQNLILSAVIKNQYSRYKNAWEFYDVVSSLGKELYGKPKFIELVV